MCVLIIVTAIYHFMMRRTLKPLAMYPLQPADGYDQTALFDNSESDPANPAVLQAQSDA